MPGQRTGRTDRVRERNRLSVEGEREQEQFAAPSGATDGSAYRLAEQDGPFKRGRIEQFTGHDAPPLDLRGEGSGDGFHFGQFRHGGSGGGSGNRVLHLPAKRRTDRAARRNAAWMSPKTALRQRPL